jgi:xanthine dehydrogenase accessory factor
LSPETLAALQQAVADGRAAILATRLSDGTQFILPNETAPPALRSAAAQAILRDESRQAEIDGESWFLHVHAPAPRLIVVGAVHITQALAPMAAMAGFAVTIVDPRRGFATAERFPGQTLIHAWPDEALATLAPDARSALVALTHDPKLDDPALDLALRSAAFFIGALGSRKSHAARLERLAALGHAPQTLARILGPVGLSIGAVTAPEIAVSIVAQLVAARRLGPPAVPA